MLHIVTYVFMVLISLSGIERVFSIPHYCEVRMPAQLRIPSSSSVNVAKYCVYVVLYIKVGEQT